MHLRNELSANLSLHKDQESYFFFAITCSRVFQKIKQKDNPPAPCALEFLLRFAFSKTNEMNNSGSHGRCLAGCNLTN